MVFTSLAVKTVEGLPNRSRDLGFGDNLPVASTPNPYTGTIQFFNLTTEPTEEEDETTILAASSTTSTNLLLSLYDPSVLLLTPCFSGFCQKSNLRPTMSLEVESPAIK